MADCRREVHVGDVGTLYKVKVLDECLPLDPTLASTAELIFSLPLWVVLTKTATVTTDGLSPVVNWYLEYRVLPNDGAGSPPGDFHAEAGIVKIQAFLEWPDGSHFHSDIVTTDEDGHELRIYSNLT